MGLIEFIKERICSTECGKRIVNWVRIRHLDEIYYDGASKRRFIHEMNYPSKEMIEARAFFEKHGDDIERNMRMLADEPSRTCYRKAILYRQTHRPEDKPEYTKKKYFPNDIVNLAKLGKEEVLIDGGAFVGDTAREFSKYMNKKYKRIICFEPDTFNYEMHKYLRLHNMVSINKGLWNEETELKFFNNMSVGSKVVETSGENVIVIPTVALDDVPEAQDATIIKLDVEGSEKNALLGAEKIIKRNKPLLIVCLYHSNSDMIDLIPLVREMNLEYKLYIKQHSHQAAETVLYAVPKR